MKWTAQWASKAAQVLSAMTFMRRSTRSSTSVVKVRTVPWISQKSGTTLVASPAWIMVTEITAVSIGFLLRVTMVWKACTIWQATGTGSMPLCGSAAWLPLPRMMILNSLELAITGPLLQCKLPDLHARPVVNAEDGLHRELLEQAVLHHLARAAAAFFGRLEHQVDGAVEIAVPEQVARRGQQHCGMPVMAAGVHLAGVRAGMGEVVVLGHRQRVDVGAQADGPAGVAVLDDADHAGLAQAAVDRDAPVGQRLGDDIGGALFLKAQFRVGMDVASDGGDAGGIGQDGFDELHANSG